MVRKFLTQPQFAAGSPGTDEILRSDSSGNATWVPLADLSQRAPRTFTLPQSNGGMGGSVATTLASATAGSYRFAVDIPTETTQWRLKLRNWDYAQTAKNAAVLKKLIIGSHSKPISGASLETGTYVGNAATTVVSTDQAINGNGTWYTSPNMTQTGEVLIGVGYTFSTSQALQTSAGRAWHWTNSTSATDPTVAGSGATQQYIPFDWVIECDVVSRRKVCLVIGDSIFEGIQTSNSAVSPSTLFRNGINQWAKATNRHIVNISLAGIAYIHFATGPLSGNYLWLRQGLTSTPAYPIDEILICVGSNDFNVGQSLAQIQANAVTVVNHLQGTLGLSSVPIYMGTLLARGATGDTVRLAYNEWISQFPAWCAGVVDFDGATRGTSAQNLVDQYTGDSIHLSWLGNVAMKEKLISVLPS